MSKRPKPLTPEQQAAISAPNGKLMPRTLRQRREAQATTPDPLAIPECLLAKNTRLTDAEWKEKVAAMRAKMPPPPAPLPFTAPKLVAPKPERPAKAPKPARPSREGLTSIAALAAEHNMIPREARALLRAAKYPKPPQGWAFPADALDAVRAILKAPAPDKKLKRPPSKVAVEVVTSFLEDTRRKPKRREKMRVAKRKLADAQFSGVGKAIHRASKKPTPAPALTNIFEAKRHRAIKETPKCPTPKTQRASSSSSTRSAPRKPSSKNTTKSKATRRRSTKPSSSSRKRSRNR